VLLMVSGYVYFLQKNETKVHQLNQVGFALQMLVKDARILMMFVSRNQHSPLQWMVR
jgi:hypothetical protein